MAPHPSCGRWGILGDVQRHSHSNRQLRGLHGGNVIKGNPPAWCDRTPAGEGSRGRDLDEFAARWQVPDLATVGPRRHAPLRAARSHPLPLRPSGQGGGCEHAARTEGRAPRPRGGGLLLLGALGEPVACAANGAPPLPHSRAGTVSVGRTPLQAPGAPTGSCTLSALRLLTAHLLGPLSRHRAPAAHGGWPPAGQSGRALAGAASGGRPGAWA
mmetsp:Transcript_113807/g.367702  ORF Transcript_113807/g.367702 Transcript_113807/m.367702 type:complete len:214 (+) Transcript_113807:714-1355(+)